MDKTVIGKNVISAALFFALAAGAGAQELPTTAPKGWECKRCPEPEEQLDGYVEAGAGHVSDDSDFYGSWTGLDNQGAYAVGDARLHYRSKEGAFADAYGDRLGIESRALGAAGGKEGSYRVYVDYDEVPYSTTEKALTPYRAIGADAECLGCEDLEQGRCWVCHAYGMGDLNRIALPAPPNP